MCRGSQSSPQARVRKFESLPMELESWKVRKLQFFESSKNFMLWEAKGLKLSSFEGLKV